MILPNIIEDTCPPSTANNCVETVGVQPVLVLKPSVASRCAPATMTFEAFLQGQTSELPITTGVTFASTNTAIVSIDASTGVATLIAAGIASISATWSGLTAFAQITVMGTGSCCEDVCVQTIVLQDNSSSMAGAWATPFAANKAAAARAMVSGFLAALQISKDAAALVRFDVTPTVQQELTSSVPDLLAGEVSIPAPSGVTDLNGAFDKALELLSAAPPCGSIDANCPGLHGHGPPPAELGVSGDTYVDDDTNGFYWKSDAGWQP